MPTLNRDFEALLDYLKQSRGFDFTAYKRSSLMRRVERRMQMVGVESFNSYIDFLEVRPDEFTALFNMILINVTSFFRDAPNWEYLASDVVPALLASKKGDQPIRIWSAGCSSGEEAYTLAMIMSETLGIGEARERVKIYATDADEEALSEARQAIYNSRRVTGLPEAIVEKYFERIGDQYAFHRDLRRNIIFGRHDLIQDAPISRIDLITCRNTLMYFNAETQARVIPRFHFALNEGGFLFLGKSETLLSHANLFTPFDLRKRIFIKVARNGERDRVLLTTPRNVEPIMQHLTAYSRLRESAADAVAVAQVVLDNAGVLAQINAHARTVFGLTNTDLGRPLQDLEFSYRPVELRSLIEQSHAERRPLFGEEVNWLTPAGEIRTFTIEVVPLWDAAGYALGSSISFTDVTLFHKLQDELQRTNQELETTLEELQSTNEELETTNEELQSTNEELETTNEELQSTNEELETMNEELQSTNEELQTINEEVRLRSDELNEANTFLEAILTSLRGGVAVIDSELRIVVWNHQAENLWGLRFDEVSNKHLLNLDIGLPIEQLKVPLRYCLAGEAPYYEELMEATNRRGKAIMCRVSLTPLLPSRDNFGDVRGAILVMEEVQELAKTSHADGTIL